MITCSKLTKEFKIYKKSLDFKGGFKGVLRDFVKKEYRIKTAVKAFDLDFDSPRLVGLLGPNGSGKTTLMKMLTGIIVPSGGYLKVLNQKPSDRKNSFKKNISLVMGNKTQLWWDIPVQDSFLLFQRYYEIADQDFKKRLGELSERLDTSKLFSIPVRKLSLGERMKVELMACLLHEPKVIFLDEPSIGLDIVSQKSVRQFLKEYYQDKKPLILLSSHYMADVEALCESIVLILDGEKKFEGSIDSFKACVKEEKTVVFHFSDPVTDFPSALEQQFPCDWSKDRFRLKVRASSKQLKELMIPIFKQFSVSDFWTEKTGVEEVMDQILSKKQNSS